MTSPQHAKADPTAPPPTKDKQGQLGLFLVVLGAALAIVVALVWTTRANRLEGQVQQKDTQLGVVTDQKDDLADRMIAICGSADAAVQERLRAVGVCQKAAEAKAGPTPTAEPTVSFGAVREAVQGYFAAHPVRDGKTPTPEELRPIIEEVFRADPPKDGRTPTSEELLTLIQQVYAANPPKDGKDGRDGEDCDPALKPACQGPQGPGIETVQFVKHSDGGCYVEVVFEPFVDGRRAPTAMRRVDPGFCYEPSPSASSTPTPTPSAPPTPSSAPPTRPS